MGLVLPWVEVHFGQQLRVFRPGEYPWFILGRSAMSKLPRVFTPPESPCAPIDSHYLKI